MHQTDPEIIDVRPEERLDPARLEPYLRERLPKTEGPFSIRQFGGGHANLTYSIAFGESEYVLRRPPLGPVAERSHDMRREHGVLSQLHRAFPIAPQSYLLCTDVEIAGADFLVEERKYGIAVRRDLPERFRANPHVAQRIGEAMIDTLALLHGVDAGAIGLGELGHPEGYVERQLTGWIQRWEKAKTSGSASADALAHRLLAKLPRSKVAAIVHNDYKLDNMLLDAGDPTRVTALLDWDMCTRGDPLMDLGYLLALWPEAGDPPQWRAFGMPTWREGFPTRAQATQRYSVKTGIDVSAIGWYYAFNVFRFAAILQQIFRRYERGQTHDERFAGFGGVANALVATATELA